MVVGPWGVILETSDGGETWNYHVPPKELEHNMWLLVAYAGTKPIIAADGSIFVYEDVNTVVEDGTEDIDVHHFSNEMYVEFEDNDIPTVNVKIFDLLGREFINSQYNFPKTIRLDISGLKSGAYLYLISTNDRLLKSGKILK
jgi:hypothetical protein